MPNTEKQLTAMQILRKRLDNQTDFARNQKEMQFICDIINDIDTELLATERQQFIDERQQGYEDGYQNGYRDAEINLK